MHIRRTKQWEPILLPSKWLKSIEQTYIHKHCLILRMNTRLLTLWRLCAVLTKVVVFFFLLLCACSNLEIIFLPQIHKKLHMSKKKNCTCICIEQIAEIKLPQTDLKRILKILVIPKMCAELVKKKKIWKHEKQKCLHKFQWKLLRCTQGGEKK